MSEILKYGSWMVAAVNLIGLIVIWIKDSKKSKKISELELVIEQLKQNNQIINLQGEYIKNIDSPIIDFYKSGYIIQENDNTLDYDFAIRFLNAGKRPAINFKYKIILYEYDAVNDNLELITSFEDESVNPIPQKNDVKLGYKFKKRKNNNEVFLKLTYSYQDIYNSKISNGVIFNKMLLSELNNEIGLFTINFMEKERIEAFKSN